MIKARHHWFYVTFFKYYIRFMFRRHFRKVVVKSTVQDRNRPLLLIGNHFSWWDGFFASYLNDRLFGRRIHVMMLEEQLRPRMFLNKAGAFSIKKQSHQMMESIRYTREILSDPDNLVTIFPQGSIHSMFDFPVSFEKGPVKILGGLEDQVQVVFMVALVDYFSHPKPTLTLAAREYVPGDTVELEDMQEAFNNYLQEMIREQKNHG
jgi:hypothetical protein